MIVCIHCSKYITAVRLPISLAPNMIHHILGFAMIDQKEIHRCLPSLVILSCLMHKLIWLVQDRLNIWSVQKSFQAQKSVGRKMWVSCVSVSRLNRGLRDYGDGAKECFPHLDLTEVNLQKNENFDLYSTDFCTYIYHPLLDNNKNERRNFWFTIH